MCPSFFIKRPSNDVIYLLHRLVIVAVTEGNCPLAGMASCCTETTVLQSRVINFCREIFELGTTSSGDQELCIQAERETWIFATEMPRCCWLDSWRCLWAAWSAWLKMGQEILTSTVLNLLVQDMTDGVHLLHLQTSAMYLSWFSGLMWRVGHV